MVWILEQFEICSLEFLPNECETAGCDRNLQRAQQSRGLDVTREGFLLLLQELHGKQEEKGTAALIWICLARL